MKRKGIGPGFGMAAALILLLPLACMRPMDADFGREKSGLADHELLWILHVPVNLDSVELASDATRFVNLQKFNQPFFQDGVSAVVRDVFAEKLVLYPDHDDQQEPEENISQRLIQMEGDKQDLSPLQQAVELVCRVDLRSSNPGMGKLSFVRLIWRYPGKNRADRIFGGVTASDLAEMEYELSLDVGDVDLMQFIEADRMYMRPVYLRTNFREYTIRSAEEADYVRDMVRRGRYYRIPWVEDGINISGKEKIELSPDQVLLFNGLYRFSQAEDTSTVYFTAERDYLIADWSQRFRIEKIMAYGDSSFFSHSGEYYHFSQIPDSGMVLHFVQGKDTLVGLRLEDEI